MRLKAMIGCALGIVCLAGSLSASDESEKYKVLATNRTSTMEKEMNESATEGYRFEATMGGESAFGGKEVVVIMSKPRSGGAAPGVYTYRLLATNKTSTMQKELLAAGGEGFEYKGQTVFDSAYGGKQVVVILERNNQKGSRRFEYRLLATNKTSTMQKELQDAADEGFLFDGVTVSQTAFGGKEVLCILRKEVTP